MRCEKEPLEEFHWNIKFLFSIVGHWEIWKMARRPLMGKMCPKVHSRMSKTTQINEKPFRRSAFELSLPLLLLLSFFLSTFISFTFYSTFHARLWAARIHVWNDQPLEKNWTSFSEFLISTLAAFYASVLVNMMNRFNTNVALLWACVAMFWSLIFSCRAHMAVLIIFGIFLLLSASFFLTPNTQPCSCAIFFYVCTTLPFLWRHWTTQLFFSYNFYSQQLIEFLLYKNLFFNSYLNYCCTFDSSYCYSSDVLIELREVLTLA